MDYSVSVCVCVGGAESRTSSNKEPHHGTNAFPLSLREWGASTMKEIQRLECAEGEGKQTSRRDGSDMPG